MANVLYDVMKQVYSGDASGPAHVAPNWETDNFKMLLCDTADYVINRAADQDHADIAAGPAGSIVATSGNIASMTANMSGNVLTVDGASFTWSGVTGDQCEATVLYKDSGSSSTSVLCVYYDDFASGMPVTPNGGDITFTPNAAGYWTWSG